jgi:hypothetical protein
MIKTLIYAIIIFLIIPTQLIGSSMIELKEKNDNEFYKIKIRNKLDISSTNYKNITLENSFRIIGSISSPSIFPSDSNKGIYLLKFNAEKIYCTTIEPPSYTHGAFIEKKMYDNQQTIIIPITKFYEFDSISFSFIVPGSMVFFTNNFIIAKSPLYSINHLFTLLFGGWNAFYPDKIYM